MKPFGMVALGVLGVTAASVPLVQLHAATSAAQSRKVPTAAQKAVKSMDSPATRKAKETQRLKAAQSKAAASKLPSLPAGIGGTWAIDPMHSRIGFAVRHVLINEVHGNFREFEGTIKVDEKDFPRSSVEFTAKVASIDTNVAQRDTHLKSPDFFDAEKYPEITFKSSRIERTSSGLRALGTFTMHGVSKQIGIPFTLRGPVVDGFGYTRAGISAALQLNRQDYGVKYDAKLPNGSSVVDNIVHVNLDLEAVKAGTGPKKE